MGNLITPIENDNYKKIPTNEIISHPNPWLNISSDGHIKVTKSNTKKFREQTRVVVSTGKNYKQN